MNKMFTLSFVILFLSLASTAFAQSSASVEINNNINSSNTSTSNIESKTNIKVETNGNVTEYSTDEPNQKIEVKSVNGESSIKVDGKEINTEKTNSLSTSPTPTPSIEISPTPSPQSKIEDFIKEKLGFIEKIFSFLDSLGK